MSLSAVDIIFMKNMCHEFAKPFEFSQCGVPKDTQIKIIEEQSDFLRCRRRSSQRIFNPLLIHSVAIIFQ